MDSGATYLIHTESADWGAITEDQAMAIIGAVPLERGVDEDGNLIFMNADRYTVGTIAWQEVGLLLQFQSSDKSENELLLESLVTAIHKVTHDEVLVTEV